VCKIKLVSKIHIVTEQDNLKKKKKKKNQTKPDLEAPLTSVGIHPVSGDRIPLVSCEQPEIRNKNG
jgi:hypothetical protein